MAEAAAEAATLFPAPLDCPLWLIVTFRFPMPSSRSKALRLLGKAPKGTTPDLDKLLRSLGDGLAAGGLIANDSRIARVWADKIEVVGWTGASVWIGEA